MITDEFDGPAGIQYVDKITRKINVDSDISVLAYLFK
jgi:hypothetical protein